MNNLLRRKFNSESGMALAMALIIMVVAMFIIVPLLFFTQTTLIVNNKVTESVKAQYAAEAGVEEALWRLSHPNISPVPWPPPGPPPGGLPYKLPDKINGYWVQYDMVKPTGTYWILTSYAYANQISEPASVVRAKLESGLGLFSYAIACRDSSAGHTHNMKVMKSEIYSWPDQNLADLYSDGDIQIQTGTKLSGTIYRFGRSFAQGPESFNDQRLPEWDNESWRELPWKQSDMWDLQLSSDGLPDEQLIGTVLYQNFDPLNPTVPVEKNLNIDTISGDKRIGPLHVTGNLNIGAGTYDVILGGRVYVDGNINKTGTQNIIDPAGTFTPPLEVRTLSAVEDVTLNVWKDELPSSQLPLIMSIGGDIVCIGENNKWICALLYAPNSDNGFNYNSNTVLQIFGALNISGLDIQKKIILKYPSGIQDEKNWPTGSQGPGKISAYSIQ